MKKTLIILILLTVFILGIYYFYFYKKENFSYLTYEVKTMDISENIEAIGEVYAKSQVDVGAQVSGQITKLYVNLGDHVKAGDLIAQIDKDKQQNEFDITKAQLASAKANLESKKVALEIATRQYEREQKLYKSKATSLESLESIKNNFYLLKANVAELNAQVTQLEISLKNAQKDLEYTTITAPSDGQIVNIAVEVGQTVNASQNAPTLVRLADLSEMEVRMQITEADINKIKIGEKVKFSILSDPDKKYEATISSIDPADTVLSDSTSTSSSSANLNSSSTSNAIYYYARFFVKNENNFLRIAMSTENQIEINHASNVLAVPTIAIKNDEKGYFVEVLKDEKVLKKHIEIGIKDSLNTEVKQGLQVGDLVIVNKQSQNVKSQNIGRIPR
ncbi:efflux RND transporter periplasmic adaptor subunit [Campylobacter sp. US33a]|uniref:efflux RND transporter periplasmic adaptor subunit n=1 Tax=Campylobacter sp. US33a TaxID=2498120 RepID=UPI0010673F75|nr:efflux RND transporter periplasmic adaptor subunit [Campylobacter sp. US33a]MCW1360823.1 efflux RND transporter periplasmic adaptor subunit [Campylobacter jejuni]TEY01156.1 efflux RND transporter periplasmic adaptor subunit [Campylobacter sp. US33a]